MSDKTSNLDALRKAGAQAKNKLAKSGRQWEDEFGFAVRAVPGLRLEHFGAPVRVVGTGKVKSGRVHPLVVFEGPAPLDLAGHYCGRHCEIDCKRMTDDNGSWPILASMSPDQVQRCHDLSEDGCMVGIALLCDVAGKCYGIPWKVLAVYLRAGKSSVSLVELDAMVRAGKVADLRPLGSLFARPFVTLLHEVALGERS